MSMTLMNIVQDVELKLEQPKLTRINDDINWYLEKLNKSRNLSKNYYLVAINRDALFNNYDNVYDLVRNISNSASQKNKKILLAIDDDGFQKKKPSEIRVPYSYSPEERSKILNLHYAIPRVEEIYFSEFQPLSVLPFDKEKLWTYDDVMYSYTNTLKSELRKITDTIGLSPFEKIIVVHNYTVHHNYRKTPIENSKSFGKLARLHPKMFSQLKSENFKFMLESDYEREGTIITDRCYIDPNEYKGFVCCGFSSVEKAFLDSLEDPNISTEFLGIQFYDKETNECISAHSVLLVRFKDDKYGIKGNYVLDPTWDATLQGFAFCLFPISDYKVYKDSSRYARIYAPENNSAFYSILASKTMKNPSDFILGDREIEDSEPIPFDTFCEAFTTLEEATKHDVFKENPLLRYQFELNEGFAKKAVENTIHSLNHFDPMLAKNDFYRKIRDFFKKHAKDGKYKDWEENFAEYSQKLVWNRE